MLLGVRNIFEKHETSGITAEAKVPVAPAFVNHFQHVQNYNQHKTRDQLDKALPSSKIIVVTKFS